MREDLLILQLCPLEESASDQIDAECNESTPEIADDRLHEDSNIFQNMTPNSHQNCSNHSINRRFKQNQGQIWNRLPLFSWRPLWTLPFKFNQTS